MKGYTFDGEYFLVLLQVGVADSKDTDKYPVLARNGEAAVAFAKAQALRDGYEIAELRELTLLAEPAYVAGKIERLFEAII